MTESNCEDVQNQQMEDDVLEEIVQQIQGYYIQNAKTKDTLVVANNSVTLIDNINLICQKRLGPSTSVDLNTRGYALNILKNIRNKKDEPLSPTLQPEPEPAEVDLTPEELAASNYVIVEKIMQYLQPDDQLVCRLVNKLWFQVATTALRKCWTDQLIFNFNFSSQTYTPYFRNLITYDDLNDFTTLLNNPHSNFPILNFKFCGGNLDSQDAIKFFSTHGHLIKGLHLYLDQTFQHPSTRLVTASLRRVLLSVQGNLECLAIEKLPYTPDPPQSPAVQIQNFYDFLFPEPRGTIQFLSLKRIILDKRVHVPQGILEDLLNVSVNLEILEHFHVTRINAVLSTKKVHTIKFMCFEDSEIEEDLDSFAKLAGSNEIKLDCLSLTGLTPNPKLTEPVIQILSSSCDSLREIYGFELLGKLPDLSATYIPALPSVTELTLDGSQEGMLPTGGILGNVFPNLKTLILLLRPGLTSGAIIKLQEEFSGLESLEEVDLSHCCLSVFLKKLVPGFSNVKVLSACTDTTMDLARLVNIIWEGLELIEIVKVGTLGRDEEWNTNCMANMDSSVTGMDEETCAQLYGNSREISVAEADTLRVGPSILDAKYLKRFEMYIGHQGFADPRQPPLMSHVAGIYGFEPSRRERGVYVLIQVSRGYQIAVAPIESYIDSLVSYV